jgi:phosphoesterase RecJ-like protein
MSDRYESNVTVARLAERIRGARHVLVTTHAKPDGDALGSVLAIVRAATSLGIRAEGWIVGPFEPNLLSLAESTPLTLVDPKKPTLPTSEPDLVVIVDTGAWNQLETLAPWLRERIDRAIGIDHHARGDLVAAERVVDVTAGAAAVIVAELVEALGVPWTCGADPKGRGSVAEAAFLGLATDTGWFRFQNARPRELTLAAKLLAAGVDKDRLIEVTENSHRPERLSIEARALTNVRFLLEGRFALMSLSLADFSATGAVVEETSGVVNMPMAVGTVRAAALLIESEPGLVKISFRSKPASDGRLFVDVNRLAAQFGGGGHVHAAGARMKTSLAEAERTIRAAVEVLVGASRPS